MRRFFYRIDFEKLNRAGFLSHRELIVVLGRLFRRSGFPLHTSLGHRWPSLKISVLHPLPVGIESNRETAIFGLKKFASPSHILDRLEPNFVPGLSVFDVVPQSNSNKPKIDRMSFRIFFESRLPFDTGTVKNLLNLERDGSRSSESNRDESTSSTSGLTMIEVESDSIKYTTKSDQQILHPGKLLETLREARDQKLPMVERVLKTEMILEEKQT